MHPAFMRVKAISFKGPRGISRGSVELRCIYGAISYKSTSHHAHAGRDAYVRRPREACRAVRAVAIIRHAQAALMLQQSSAMSGLDRRARDPASTVTTVR
eukprot:2149560-Pleurochrysis_carterae.AAC.1